MIVLREIEPEILATMIEPQVDIFPDLLCKTRGTPLSTYHHSRSGVEDNGADLPVAIASSLGLGRIMNYWWSLIRPCVQHVRFSGCVLMVVPATKTLSEDWIL